MPAVWGFGGIVWAADCYTGHGAAECGGLGRQEQVYRSGATTWDGIHQQIVRDNAVRRDAADSRGFDTAHEAGAMLAEEAKTISEWCDGVATKCGGIAGVLRKRLRHNSNSFEMPTRRSTQRSCRGSGRPSLGPITRRLALRPAGASRRRLHCTHRSRPAPKIPAL